MEIARKDVGRARGEVAEPYAPWRIGPFEVRGRLGAGRMGVVYAGVHVDSGEWVAIKTVALRRVELLAGIRREIFALRQLAHPGIVRIVADGVAEQGPWYAMERLEGDTLRAWCDAAWQRVDSAPPGADSALSWIVTVIRRIADTLAYVHGEGFIHGDLKPENVFLRPGGQPILVDFGLASWQRSEAARAALSAASVLAGTPQYMAPEQITGEPVDARADLYALGCMLYELLTGHPPFEAATGSEILAHHLYSAPEPPSARSGIATAELDALVLALLAKVPCERMGQAIDVVAALERPEGRDSLPHMEPPRSMVLYVPRLVGRDGVLADIASMVDAVARGTGGMTLISGESGMGKTHLMTEVARRCGARLRVVTSTCTPIGSPFQSRHGRPLHPLKPVLDAVSDFCAERGPDAARKLLGGRAHLLSPYEPSLAAWCPNPEPDLPQVQGEEARERLFSALRETIAAFAAEQPLVVLIDDLQWADELTLAFLEGLPPGWLEAQPVLVVLALRDEGSEAVVAALRRRVDVRPIVLQGIDEPSVGRAVADMLALPAPPLQTARLLFQQSEGNPFYVTECVRAALAEGLFRRTEPARLGAASQLEPDERLLRHLVLPAPLHALISRRLERLDESARDILAAAAVVGREFGIHLLQAVARVDEATAMAAVTELVRRHALEMLPSGAMHFVHDKLAELAYGRLAGERRRALHQRAAEAIAEASGESPGDWAMLAHHWQQAGEPAREQPCRAHAAEQAFALSAFAEAAEQWRRAIELGESRASGTDASTASLVAWESGAARAEFARGDMDGAERHARPALARLGRPMPSRPRGWNALLLGQLAVQIGHLLGMRRRRLPPERCVAVTNAARAAALLTHRYYYADETAPLLATSLLCVNLAERGGVGTEVPRAYLAVALLAGLLRRHRLAERYFALARDGAERLDPAERAYGLTTQSVYLATFGRFPEAEAPALAAVDIVRQSCEGFVREMAEVMPGHVAYYTGRLREALAIYTEVERLARERGRAQTITWGIFSQARVLHALGRFDDALPLFEQAREMLVQRPEVQSETAVYGLLASTLLHLGRTDEALVRADEALERMRRVQSVGFTSDEGYAAALRVYLRCAATASGGRAQHLDRRVRELQRILRRMALVIPSARPLALLRRGEYDELRGRVHRASRLYRHSLATAEGYGMQRYAALANHALARTAATEIERQEHGAAAARWLIASGCAVDLSPQPAASW